MKRLLPLFLAFLAYAGLSAQIASGLTNDFEDGTTQGWSNGGGSPNPPTNISTGGPGGTNDNFLEEESAGGGGPGSRMVAFNRSAEWLGDYTAAGVVGISFDAQTPSDQELSLRFAVSSTGGTEMATTVAVTVPALSTWTAYEIPIDAADFTVTSGSETAAQVLQDVNEVRILSSQAPAFIGDAIAGVMHLDNVTAVATLGVNGKIKRKKVKIFPNPGSSRVTMTSQSSMSSYRIYNVLGALVAEESINSRQTEIDISGLNSGVYLVEVAADNTRTTLKLVKN